MLFYHTNGKCQLNENRWLEIYDMSIVSQKKYLKNTIQQIIPDVVTKKLEEFRYNNRVKHLIEKSKRIAFPMTLNLSLSSLCQARCIYCPTDRGKGIDPPVMSFETAKKVIDEAAREGFEGTVRFSENGEALLNKDFFEVFEYFSATLSKSRSILYTNMALLDQETGMRLLKYKLDELHLNIDGATAETYHATKKLDFQRFKKNLLDFIEIRNQLEAPCKIHVSVLTAKSYMLSIEKNDIDLPDDTKQIVEFWEPLLNKSDVISIIDKPYKWALSGKQKTRKTNACRKLSKVIKECLIGPNGDIYLCCLDHQQKCVIGNINNNTIKEIWSSQKRFGTLELLRVRRYNEIGEPCEFCLD